MRSLLLAAAIWAVAGTQADAEVLDITQVPADAQWLLHADVDGMVAGDLPQTIGRLWLQLPDAARMMRLLENIGGMDPRKDLHGLTLYGTDYEQDSGVLLMRADVNRLRVKRFLGRQPGYAMSKYAGHEVVVWTQNKGKSNEHRATVCFYRPTLVVVGRDTDKVKAAVDVLRGASSPMVADSHQLVAMREEGTMIQAWGTGLGEVRLKFESPLVRKSKSMSAVLGERGEQAFAKIRVVTESKEVANQLSAVVQGLLAMARLQFDADPQVVKFLNSVRVSVLDDVLVAECDVSVEQVATLIGKTWAKQLKAAGSR